LPSNGGSSSEVLIQLRELRSELADAGVLNRIDAALADLLPAEPADLEGSDKIVKDLVWGIISMPGFLVPLIDSRLLQRQRRIRQLGLSYLVYPSAGYSRFEHALGCCHVMSELLRAVQNGARRIPEGARLESIPEERRKQLLLGALLHDVGHMPFSHASEEGVQEFIADLKFGTKSVTHVVSRISDVMDKDLALAEVISVLIILSPRFQRFMKSLAPLNEERSLNFFLEVAVFVAGGRLSNLDIAYSSVLSGPLDADKLDYMVRDAHVSGIPIAVDIPRLLARCAFVKVPTSDLPEPMRKRIEDSLSLLFVTDLSGANALEELTISRFILNDRIYNHQKTRAAEAVLTELLQKAFKTKLFDSDLLTFWSLTDESFLHLALDKAETTTLAAKLLYRDLPKRAVVYGNRQIGRPVIPSRAANQTDDDEIVRQETRRVAVIEDEVSSLLDDIDEAFRISTSGESIQNEILAKATELAELVSTEHRPKRSLQMVVVKHRPQDPFAAVGDAFVIDQDTRITRFKSHLPLAQWAGAYQIGKKFGYVYCDSGWEHLVDIATELVLWDRFPHCRDDLEVRFRLTLAATTRAKLKASLIKRLKEILDGKGVFDKARPLRPVIISDSRLANLADRFGGFQGAAGWTVRKDTIEGFVRQFPCKLQKSVCDLLEKLKYLDRGALTSGLGRQLQRCSELIPNGKLRVVPLTPNSGHLMRMLAEADLKAKLGPRFVFEQSELSALSVSDDAIVTVDDLVTSGSQACTQLQALMGLPKDEWQDKDEKNIFEEPLSSPQRNSLKGCEVKALFAYGMESGRSALKETARALGIAKFDVLVDELGDPSDLAKQIDSSLRDFMTETGRDLLTTMRGNVGASENEADALGYGGASDLVVSIFNVPTCCPACLWCPGIVNGASWVPLFIRRGYQHRAVFV